ncbi:MAG: type VI secretion system-associated protein TagF [Pseudomonadota bacterium]
MAGLFGKLPAAGDFVARGLAPGLRPVLDRWITRHLAEAARHPELWPETGLHAVIEAPTGACALALIPSRDTSGRHFPLAACAPGSSDRDGVELWASAATPLLVEAREMGHSADALHAELSALPDLAAAEPALVPPVLWAEDSPTAPPEALRTLFGEIT